MHEIFSPILCRKQIINEIPKDVDIAEAPVVFRDVLCSVKCADKQQLLHNLSMIKTLLKFPHVPRRREGDNKVTCKKHNGLRGNGLRVIVIRPRCRSLATAAGKP